MRFFSFLPCLLACLLAPWLPPFQLFTVQSKWYWASFAMMGLSIGLYLAVVSFINSFVLLDYDFYQVLFHLPVARKLGFWCAARCSKIFSPQFLHTFKLRLRIICCSFSLYSFIPSRVNFPVFRFPSCFGTFEKVWNRLTGNTSFWLTVLLLVALVGAKDMYIGGLERNFNFKPWHIIQEVTVKRATPSSVAIISWLIH